MDRHDDWTPQEAPPGFAEHVVRLALEAKRKTAVEEAAPMGNGAPVGKARTYKLMRTVMAYVAWAAPLLLFVADHVRMRNALDDATRARNEAMTREIWGEEKPAEAVETDDFERLQIERVRLKAEQRRIEVELVQLLDEREQAQAKMREDARAPVGVARQQVEELSARINDHFDQLAKVKRDLNRVISSSAAADSRRLYPGAYEIEGLPR